VKKLVWLTHSHLKLGDGYGYAADNILSRLKKTFTFAYPPSSPSDLELPPGVGYSVECKCPESITFQNGLPPYFNNHGKYNVGFCYWETDKVPDGWIPHMQRMDEIWTTSDFVYNVFKSCNVNENIYKFNLGFDNNVFTKTESTPNGPFTFLSIGSPSTRKNSQIAVDAFVKVKSKYKDIRLIYKSSGPPDARLYHGNMRQALYNVPYINVIDTILSEQEYADMYRKAHCLIYPTSGEGWGMIPFQAIAMGIPTICTNATSCTEYSDLSIPLNFEWSPVQMGGVYSNTGNWAMPSLDDLCDKMIYAIENYEYEKDRALSAADFLHENYTWDIVSKDYKDRIWEILKK
jgi:glycosyltransferase involved in cell wall biosynthesis